MMSLFTKGTKHNTQRYFTIATLAAFLYISLALISCKVIQKEFASPSEAAQALVTALRTDDDKKLLAVLGPEANELIYSGDAVADLTSRQKFLELYDEQNRVEPDGDRFFLVIGENNWPFPIPLIQKEKGWVFDTPGGKEEILNRRIGRNELNTVQVLLAIVDAQREYAMEDRDNDTFLEYARKFISDPGMKNGLYWATQEGEEPSPIGELVAHAQAMGYASDEEQQGPWPFHGYYYRIITAQGDNASGGAYDYIVNDRMIGGFAVVAYPAEYGNSGIMTFIVNYDGIVYQKDLGEDTAAIAKAMNLYDPDGTWTPVQ